MIGNDPFAVLVMGTIAAMSSTVYGIAALWAVWGRANWFWRVAPAVLLLAAMAPIGAYELQVMFAVQCGLVVAVAVSVRWVQRWRAARRARAQAAEPATGRQRFRLPTWQFGLFDVLQAVVLAAALLALVRLADRTVDVAQHSPTEWLQWVTLGLGLGAGTLGAAYLVGGATRWYVRAIGCGLLLVAAGALAWQGGLIEILTYSSGYGVWPSGWCFIFAGAHILLTTGWLLLARATGWAGWGRNAARATDGTGSAPTSKWRGRGAFAAGTALAVLSLLGIVALGNVYWALLPREAPAQDPLPEPNGFDEVAKIGASLNWAAVPDQDHELASVQACQQFTRDNAAQLTRLRAAFDMPSRVPVVFDDLYMSSRLNDIQTFREIARALSVEGKAAAATGRTSDAVRTYLDDVRLAKSAAYGGLMVEDMVGNAIEGVGLNALVDQFNNVNVDDLETITRELEVYERGREPIETIIDRDHIWTSRAFGWLGRLWTWMDETYYGSATDALYALGRARTSAKARLVFAEAAARHYQAVNGAPPESLESLVPDYLEAVPQDPYGHGPLVYRRTPDGYLLYSVGANGLDDGGQRVSLGQALDEDDPAGDLFFDAKWDSP